MTKKLGENYVERRPSNIVNDENWFMSFLNLRNLRKNIFVIISFVELKCFSLFGPSILNLFCNFCTVFSCIKRVVSQLKKKDTNYYI